MDKGNIESLVYAHPITKGCDYSDDGRHMFHTTRGIKSDTTPFEASAMYTCIVCGHKRAVDILGNLWIYIGKAWVQKGGEHGKQ